mmetsp:Transcript_22803/g.32639  ORF Transcript_22803/g.32639 Transcript_22803/m.32639 type:complete len:321 (-) Transcript_22803:67-1029(-)
MASFPSYVIARVEKLKELNEKRDGIMEEYLKDRAALEQRYQMLRNPLYEERAEIIAGKHDEKIAADRPTTQNDNSENEEEETEQRAKGIPQFWICAMSHNETIGEYLAEEDVDCLEHLKDIRSIDHEDGKGFTLEFYFDAPNNPFFTNPLLTKQYNVPNLLIADEPILKKVIGCEIDWKSGRSLVYREVTKKQRGKGKNVGQVRTVRKQERKDSFFHFFDPPKMPSMDEMDEEEADRLEEAFDQDYEVAQAFRECIIPKAVLWFTGEALEEEMEGMLQSMEEDDQDENEQKKTRKRKGKSKANPFPTTDGNNENPECKQS